ARTSYQLTKVGRWWLGITLLFLGIGLGKGINLLLLLAYCMLVIFLLNLLRAGRQTRRVQARYRLPDQMFARTPCPISVDLQNDDRGKAALHFEAHGKDHALQWFVPWLSRLGSETLRSEVTLPRRGRYSLGPLWASSGYPFGLYTRWRCVGADTECLV